MGTVVDLSGNSPIPHPEPHIEAHGLDESLFVSSYLTTVAGSNDMAVDGSTPVTFSYRVSPGTHLISGRLLIYLETATAMDSIEFGDLAVLANGVSIKIDGLEISNWKDNIDMLTDLFDLVEAGAAFGKATKTLVGRWTFWKAHADMAGLEANSSVSVVVRDNLSTLAIFRIKVQGGLVDA